MRSHYLVSNLPAYRWLHTEEMEATFALPARRGGTNGEHIWSILARLPKDRTVGLFFPEAALHQVKCC